MSKGSAGERTGDRAQEDVCMSLRVMTEKRTMDYQVSDNPYKGEKLRKLKYGQTECFGKRDKRTCG